MFAILAILAILAHVRPALIRPFSEGVTEIQDGFEWLIKLLSQPMSYLITHVFESFSRKTKISINDEKILGFDLFPSFPYGRLVTGILEAVPFEWLKL